MSLPTDFLLATTNPIANRDQMAAEEDALAVLKTQTYKDARTRTAFLWRLAYGEDARAEALPMFEEAMDEYAFNYVLKAVASDENYPRLVRDFMPPHSWFGRSLPGARMGGDNPDNCYRVGGVAHGARYEVSGKVIGRPAANVSFTLVANYGTSVTLQTLDFNDVERASDGSFTITIDATPAQGRRNHLCTAPGCKFLFVRDSMSDWNQETPLALCLRRVDAPSADPLTIEQMAARAAHRMIEEVPLYYWFTRLFSGKPVNTFSVQLASGSLGGLVTQAGAQGRLKLADDEAAVVTVDPAGATYAGIVVHDWWFRTRPYWSHTASLTSPASTPDADGRFTYVVSAADPGVHNWIDTGGMRETLILYRWQGLPAQKVRQGPAIDPVRVVKLSELPRVLPKETVMTNSQGRAQQLESRLRGFARRLIEQ